MIFRKALHNIIIMWRKYETSRHLQNMKKNDNLGELCVSSVFYPGEHLYPTFYWFLCLLQRKNLINIFNEKHKLYMSAECEHSKYYLFFSIHNVNAKLVRWWMERWSGYARWPPRELSRNPIVQWWSINEFLIKNVIWMNVEAIYDGELQLLLLFNNTWENNVVLCIF